MRFDGDVEALTTLFCNNMYTLVLILAHAGKKKKKKEKKKIASYLQTQCSRAGGRRTKIQQTNSLAQAVIVLGFGFSFPGCPLAQLADGVAQQVDLHCV